MKNKQVLDAQQMQHLQELGFDTSNASASWYKPDMSTEYIQTFGQLAYEDLVGNEENIPAYTLQDVLDALPEKITHKHKDYLIEIWKRDGEWYIGYLFFDVDDVVHLHDETNKSFIDAAYEMLCWVIDNKFVETNKNE